MEARCPVGCVEKDAFLLKVRELHQPPTKRGILSAVSSLYVLEAKTILHRLWKLNPGWDNLIPLDQLQVRVGRVITGLSTAMPPDRHQSN